MPFVLSQVLLKSNYTCLLWKTELGLPFTATRPYSPAFSNMKNKTDEKETAWRPKAWKSITFASSRGLSNSTKTIDSSLWCRKFYLTEKLIKSSRYALKLDCLSTSLHRQTQLGSTSFNNGSSWSLSRIMYSNRTSVLLYRRSNLTWDFFLAHSELAKAWRSSLRGLRYISAINFIIVIILDYS